MNATTVIVDREEALLLERRQTFRVGLILTVMVMLLIALALRLFTVQVMGRAVCQQKQDRQSIRCIHTPGVRGRIRTSDGAVLAETRTVYGLALDLAALRRRGPWKQMLAEAEQLGARLTATLGVPVQVTAEAITRHMRRRSSLPFVVCPNLPPHAMARFAERQSEFPAAYICEESERRYPQGRLAAPLVGYVGYATLRDEPSVYVDLEVPEYELPAVAGRAGVEAICENRLAGRPGQRFVRVDACGFVHDEVGSRQAYRGGDVTLTLNSRWQALAENLLGSDKGAAVVMDVTNGDLLVLASSPSVAPADMVAGLTPARWLALQEDPDKPLVNRAVAGCYPPGSTFKALVASALLSLHPELADLPVTCPGHFDLGRTRFHCWRPQGHGAVTVVEAIEGSCNTYFMTVGTRCGPDAILRVARECGLGQVTGCGLPDERPGLLPGPEWKLRHAHDAWRAGDTANTVIGQGFLSVTPLQMAVVTAALANGGNVLRPRILRDETSFAPAPRRQLSVTPAALALVREAMRRVVDSDHGTGKLGRVEGLVYGAKTGTSEVVSGGQRRKFAWVIAFAPFDHPRLAAVMLVEDGVSGGATVAPRMGQLMAELFDCHPDALAGGATGR